jgi:hypothetical protein
MRQWANGQMIANDRDARQTGGMSDAQSRSGPSLFGTPREWAKDMAIATALGVFLGVIGPFGSYYGGNIEVRIAYWTANMWIGFIVISASVRLSIRAAIRLDLPVWFALAIGVAIGSLPLGFIIGWFSALFWPGNHGHLSSFAIWYGQTLAVAEPFSFGYYFLGDRAGGGWRSAVAEAIETQRACAPAAAFQGVETSSAIKSPPSRQALPDGAGAFLDRLPPRLGRELLCLQMEDHYVRAHTERGSDLILTPLKDAIAELGEVEGMQVHRSWWVARAAVAEPVANGRNLVLQLVNGLRVPVSRPSVAKLKAAGWIDPA